ncbi:hypothetical protein LCGC14_2435490 [marine sediment metagenome]|uniref:Uncharacterized protein n=1 Tax=marine sediment metagenome TaxID=412755 RepID=A0A0F9C7Z8_9ZZZZ
MAEELEIQGALDRLAQYNLNPIERLLAGHTGTVQLLLSLWFNTEVTVLVERQQEYDVKVIKRQGALMADYLRNGERLAVCGVLSYIDVPKCSESVVHLVRAQELGLGQIAVLLGIPTVRSLTDLEVDDRRIQRTYIMEGPGLHYTITEAFPRELFQGVFCWPEAAAKMAISSSIPRNRPRE